MLVIIVTGDEIPLDSSCVDYCSVPTTNTHYLWETEENLINQLREEYDDSQPWMLRLVQQCIEWAEQYSIKKGRALHSGCGTGRGSIILAQHFSDVSTFTIP